MTSNTGPEAKVEAYLLRVRSALRGLPATQKEEILRELRAHILERAEAGSSGMEAALTALGDPVALAKMYLANNLFELAACTCSPLLVLDSVGRLAKRSVAGFTVFVTVIAGNTMGVMLLFAAVEKFFSPIWPAQVGLWYSAASPWYNSLSLLFESRGPAGSREVLGWWLVPVAFAAGYGLCFLMKRLGLWWIDRFRRAAVVQTG